MGHTPGLQEISELMRGELRASIRPQQVRGRTDLRSFIGLTNQLTTYTKELAPALTPLRSLLSTRNDFLWTPDHDIAFQQLL